MYFGFHKLAWIIVAYGSWIYNYTNAITTDVVSLNLDQGEVYNIM